MIGYHIQNMGIVNSLGEVCQGPPYLEWLLLNHPEENHKIFYDLDGSVASLLRLVGITEEECLRLVDKGRVRIGGGLYRLLYYPKRVFGIDKGYGAGHPFCNYYNAAQYQDAHYKHELLVWPLGVEYAIGKAREATKVGDEVLRVYRKLGFPTESLASPASAVAKGMLPKANPPTVDDIPEEAHTLAYKAVKANWLEAYSMGYWERAYDYDINGAYGFELSKLLDLRRGRWIEGVGKPKGATYGFVEGDITTRADFHPFLLNTEGDMTYTPAGTWSTALTMQEIEFLYEYKLGEFAIENGWWWVPEGQQNEVLKGLVNWLYSKRMGTKGIVRGILHRAIAGIWGLFLQFKGGKFGEFMNPVYGAVVEANTRIRVAKACLDAGVVPLHVAVDGVITDSPLPVKCSDDMGDWRLSHEGACIIAGCGAVAFEGKGGPEEFSLKYDWLRGEIDKKPRARQYRMSKYAPVKLGEAIVKDKMDRLGCVDRTTRTVFIGPDSKRIWKETPRTGGDLLSNHYESAPWEVGVILKDGGIS